MARGGPATQESCVVLAGIGRQPTARLEVIGPIWPTAYARIRHTGSNRWAAKKVGENPVSNEGKNENTNTPASESSAADPVQLFGFRIARDLAE
jgi:hypothetical protein